jgi:enterobactin synthetase component D
VVAAFRLDLPHGRCVGVEIPDGDLPAELLAALDPEERALLATLPPTRQASFAAGRAALRGAIADLGLPLAPLLPEGRGGPRLPAGVIGSISHKRRLAVALAAPAQGQGALGVDLEEARPFRIDISRRVLTPGEQADVAALSEPGRTSAVLARFCLKEAFYKAANGFVGRLISFQEVAVAAIDAGGRATFSGPLFAAHPLAVDGWVGQPWPGYIVASVIARPSSGAR